jgi:predicted Zn-dependent peptidase
MHYALFFEDAGRINSDLDRYLAVTPEDILKAAQNVFRPENRTLLVVEPGNGRQQTTDNRQQTTDN